MAENVFEKAVRNKFRFSYKGSQSVEDLWDLTPSELDLIFKDLNRLVKAGKEESLLGQKTSETQELEDKIEIVKYIVNVKLAEVEKRLKQKENAKKKEEILTILSDINSSELKSKSKEELLGMLKDLD